MIDADLFFVIGLVVAGFSFPAIVGALAEGRPPRTAAIMVVIAAGLIGAAVYDKPGFYSLATTPDAFVRVVARYIN